MASLGGLLCQVCIQHNIITDVQILQPSANCGVLRSQSSGCTVVCLALAHGVPVMTWYVGTVC